MDRVSIGIADHLLLKKKKVRPLSPLTFAAPIKIWHTVERGEEQRKQSKMHFNPPPLLKFYAAPQFKAARAGSVNTYSENIPTISAKYVIKREQQAVPKSLQEGLKTAFQKGPQLQEKTTGFHRNKPVSFFVIFLLLWHDAKVCEFSVSFLSSFKRAKNCSQSEPDAPLIPSSISSAFDAKAQPCVGLSPALASNGKWTR